MLKCKSQLINKIKTSINKIHQFIINQLNINYYKLNKNQFEL